MTIKEIDETIEEGQSLKAIAQAYSEIANLKIKRIRAEVERNRMFLEEVSKVYGLVKAHAIKKNVAVVKPKKRLCILVTSNYRFYGSINAPLINYFLGSTRQLPDVDKMIIGKGGIDFFRATKLLSNYQEVVLKSDMPEAAELANLAALSADYNQVLVFHAKFKSLIVQAATFSDITAVSIYLKALTEDYGKKGKGTLQFIFEPELIKILAFFDNQVLTLLLEQVFLESELSRTAARFIAMDHAEIESIKFIKQYQTLKAYVKRNLDNNKILENFATLMAVKHKNDNG